MLVRARQRGLPGKLPRTGCGACPNVPCVQCRATRPLASDSRPLVSLFMFLHTQYTLLQCSLCEHVPQPAGLRRHLGKAIWSKAFCQPCGSGVKPLPDQVKFWHGGARTHPSSSARTSSHLPQGVLISVDPVHLYSHPREEKLPPAAQVCCKVSCRCERLSRLAG